MSKRRTGPPSISLRLSPAPEPTTPDTNRSPTDADSLAPSESKWVSFGQLSPGVSQLSTELNENIEQGSSITLYEKPRGHKPLLLLARSRGVQTESGHTQSATSSHLSSHSPHDPRSETSSFSESQPSHMSSILERIVALFNRIAQADALTLTNRLKRQHLKGADVGHLSRSTVSSILAEVTGLRTQFRFLLEDERTVTSCSRKDLRLFFKVVKDIFIEVGQLRVAMNDVVLDPSSAVRLSEIALNPSKADADDARETAGHGGAVAWMAPLSKLFLPSTIAKSDSGGSGDRLVPSYGSRTGTGGTNASRPPKFVPKLGPALAASATTVNVEFSGTGVGRAVTSTVRLQPTVSTSETPSSTIDAPSSGLMGIFAGAQKMIEPADPWVVLPSVPRKKPSPSLMENEESNIAAGISTIGRSALRRPTKRLSRNVDAVIDVVDGPRALDDQGEEQDYASLLMQRTLRRRGLSDSSIHSTFTNQGGEKSSNIPPSPKKNASPASRMPAWRDPNAMFQAFRWGMFSLGQPVPSTDSDAHAKMSTPFTQSQRGASTAVATLPSDDEPTIPAAPVGRTPPLTPASRVAQPKPIRVTSPNRGGVLPNLTSWATSSIITDSSVSGSDPFIASSLRDETYFRRAIRRSKDDAHARDFY